MNDVQTHPAVIAASVGVAVVVVLLVGGRKAATLVAPAWEWWVNRTERRFQRQVRIEAAARFLNDERVDILLSRIDGLGAEIIAQRAELVAQRDEERDRANRLENDLGQLRLKLDRVMREVSAVDRTPMGGV